MSSAISNVFTLLQTCINTVTANPLLAILLGLAVASVIFGLLMYIFRR